MRLIQVLRLDAEDNDYTYAIRTVLIGWLLKGERQVTRFHCSEGLSIEKVTQKIGGESE